MTPTSTVSPSSSPTPPLADLVRSTAAQVIAWTVGMAALSVVIKVIVAG